MYFVVVPEVPGLLEDFYRKFPLQLSSQTHFAEIEDGKVIAKN